MDLFLAIDLKGGLVVHGSSGQREKYRPLTWGLSPTAEPEGYVRNLSPRKIYVADLDRIAGTGDNTGTALALARMVRGCLLDRGAHGPGDFLHDPFVTDVASTESSRVDLSLYPSGFLSVDIREGRVIPSGADPRTILSEADSWNFSGAIVLDVGAVGTGRGLDLPLLGRLRGAYGRTLLYGGGIAGAADLDTLASIGFDGAIVSTAVHRGQVPVGAVRRGRWS
ncbi:MAG: HisA/HisF-related TIM barrel protein [Methanolinea sp.]|nr:HisA/HisF-related TIM barrel protein [Methanolinea sp.]